MLRALVKFFASLFVSLLEYVGIISTPPSTTLVPSPVPTTQEPSARDVPISKEDTEFYDTLRNKIYINDGAASDIYSVVWKGEKVAIKKYNHKLYDFFVNEKNIHSSMNHPQIVNFLRYVDYLSVQIIVMELVEGENFAHYLETHSYWRRDKEKCRAVTLDAAKALVYMHGLGIIHNDIKPDNILIGQVTKVCDFSLSYQLPKGQNEYKTTKIWCTPSWAAPEVQPFLNAMKVYSRACDIYTIGWVMYLWQTASGILPFDGEQSTLDKIFRGELPSFPSTTPPATKALILRCLDKNPRARATAEDVVRGLTEMPKIT